MSDLTLDTISAHLRQTGFLFQGSSIYGGLSNTWDFGPLGVLLKNNIKQLWWKAFVQESPTNVGLDAAILMNPLVWKASGHLDTFNDPLMDCKECNSRHRADNLIEDFDSSVNAANMSLEEMKDFIDSHQVPCPKCGKSNFTEIRQFNLMFQTYQGVTKESSSILYLRPETAQGIFVNYRNVQRAMRLKLPFGVAQIGKSFRNEITPGQMIFRTREFEQMELEFFCKPGTDLDWYDYWKKYCMDWLVGLGLSRDNLRFRDHGQAELSFYSKATCDIEYLFPWGWGELWGIADRTDYDLKQHQNASKVSMEYLDPETNEKYIPYCVEPSVGVERLFLALVCESYRVEQLDKEERLVMELHPNLAPYRCAILPLSKKLSDKAMEIYRTLSKHVMADFDETGSIGKRYRRQDQIGTPYCITVDFDTLDDGCVTIRNRDTMEQKRVKIEDILKECR